MDEPEMNRHAREAELELVRACAAGDATACREFERAFAGCLEAGAARVCSDADFVAEIAQSLRMELFTGTQPRALSFTGRGPLSAWLKVVATRAALDRVRSEGRAHARERGTRFLSSNSSTGVERRLDRQRDGGRYAAALDEALEGLSARDRNLLRLRFASGLGIDAIGVAYGVHRATVARWIAHALQEVGRSMRAQFTGELDSTLRDVESQLAGVLGGFLASSRPPRAPEPAGR